MEQLCECGRPAAFKVNLCTIDGELLAETKLCNSCFIHKTIQMHTEGLDLDAGSRVDRQAAEAAALEPEPPEPEGLPCMGCGRVGCSGHCQQ